MNPVRAKFRCVAITRRLGYGSPVGEVHDVKFNAVSGDSEENKMFFSATPTGSIEVTTINPGLFELNQYYYVDFTPTGQ